MCIFSPLSNTVYEWVEYVKNEQGSRVDVENERAEWMWTISEENIYLRLAKKQTFMCFCFVLI